MLQRTLKDSFTISGKGLHTGVSVTATLLPAEVNHGYKFQRTDLEGQPTIDALAENVVDTMRGTALSQNGATISTVEHVLASLYAYGIDNCLIQINGPEMPILNGSAIEWVNKIEEVGFVEQEEDKDFYVVRQKIELKDENTGASLIVLPDPDFSIDTMIDYDSAILGNQFATMQSFDRFKDEIAASRTFVFVREIEPLLHNNLIKGGDLDNAIVIYDSPMTQDDLDRISSLMGAPRHSADELVYINNKPLVFKNEPARHKLLDVIGDIALIGRPMHGRVIATKPGHTINTTFAKKVRREIRRQECQAPIYNPNNPPVMDVNRIRQLLPHRYPFLLVDKVIDMGMSHIVGLKNITGNEPFFQGHFPQEPVMPGVLMVEAMAQVGGLLVLNTVDEPERYSTYFMKIDNVRFRQKVVPGDTLLFHVSFMTELRRGCAMMKGYAFVGDKIVCEAEFMAQIVKNK